MAAPSFPANVPPTTVALLDSWLLGDESIVWVMELKPILLSSSTETTIYVATARYPGAKAAPRLVLPSMAISILNSGFGTRDTLTGPGAARGRRMRPAYVEFDQFRSGQLERGVFAVLNPDGLYDSWVTDYGWADADGLLKVGRRTDTYASLESFLPFKVRSEPVWNQESITFAIKGAGINLNQPVARTTFTGAGGMEGGDDLDGRSKPLLLGKVYNIRPPLVDTSVNAFLIDPDGCDSIGTIYEGGLDVGAIAAKDAANGKFTLGRRPSREITCDAVGKDRRAAGDQYQATLIKTLIDDIAGGATPVTSGLQNDAGLFMDAGEQWTYEEALSWLVRPLGAFYPRQDGAVILAGELGEPESGSATATYTRAEIVSIERVETAPPAYFSRVGYAELAYVNTELSAITSAERSRLTHERKYRRATTAGVRADYRNALALDAVSGLYASAAAQTAATALQGTMSVKRDIYRVTLARKVLQSWVGDVVSIDFPRYGLDGGKLVLVTGWDIQLSSRRFVLEVYG